MSRDLRCGDAPPSGATLPPPLPAYTGGACPTLSPGRNTITSSGSAREFVLVTPSDMAPGEQLPLVVMWHHLGGDANSLLTHGEAQRSADELRFIAAIPEKKGDLTIDVIFDEFDMVWPYLDTVTTARMEEEAVFFDDMVSCIAAQYGINESCVSTAGISAGALWSAQLLQLRSERLASAIILSGGVGPATTNGFIDVQGWRGAAHRTPVLLAWGGPTDACGADFNRASMNLGAALTSAGHFVEECLHNCGHAAPPVDPMVGLPILWRFALDHPYWLEDGESPYLAVGLPEGTPDWCATSYGGASIRTGACSSEGGMACPVGAL
ncbi:MAG: PHB depolymerase family esterase [Sandaracinaceae bacterium]